MLTQILPGIVFFSKGTNQNPSVIMIDDSSSEKELFVSKCSNFYEHFLHSAVQMDLLTQC